MKNIVKTVLALITMMACMLTSPVTAQNNTGVSKFRTFAYYTYWNATDHDKVDYTAITDLIYAFAIPNLDGSGNLLPLEGADTLIPKIKAQCELHDSNLLLGLGGWSYNRNVLDPVFTAATSTPAKTTLLINNILKYVNDYGFDGVDVDWEFPEARNQLQFNVFVQQLSKALHDEGKTISMSVAANSYHGRFIADKTLSDVDHVLAMTHWHDQNVSLNYWTSRVPAEKFGMGVIFHASPWGTHNWKNFGDIVALGAAPFASYFEGTQYWGINTLKNELIPRNWQKANNLLIWSVNQDNFNDYDKSLVKAIIDGVRQQDPTWRLEGEETRYFYLKNVKSGKYAKQMDGHTFVEMTPKSTSERMLWSFEVFDDYRWIVRNKETNRVLDFYGNDNVLGTWNKHGGWNQQIKFIKVAGDSGCFHLESSLSASKVFIADGVTPYISYGEKPADADSAYWKIEAADLGPEIALLSSKQEATATTNLTLSVSVTSTSSVKKVELAYNNVVVASIENPATIIELAYDAPVEDHSVTVYAYDNNGQRSQRAYDIMGVETPDGSSANTWDAAAIYTQGDTVVVDGVTYTAQWWTRGEDPRTSVGVGLPWAIN